MHCFNSVPGNAMYPLGNDPNTFLLNYRPATVARVSDNYAVLLTRDGGRTFEKLVGDHQSIDVAGYERRPLVSLTHPLFIDENFWVASGGLGIPLNYNGGERSLLVIVVNGAPVEVNGVSTGLRMPDGISADMIWKADARHWIARSEGFAFATRDAGATWTLVGPAPFIREGSTYLLPLAWSGNKAVFYFPQDGNRGFLLERGKPRQEIRWQPTLIDGYLANAFRATFWNGLVVGSVYTEVITSPDTFTWTPLKTDPKATAQLGLYVDRQNRLWAYPDAHYGSNMDPHFKVYRWETGNDAPVVVDFDFGGLAVEHLSSLREDPDGRLRFLAVTKRGGEYFGSHRDVRGTLFCEAGPGVTAGFDPLVTEPLEAVSSGRMITVERMRDGSEYRSRLAIAPSGRMYSISEQALYGGPPDMPEIYFIGRIGVPDPNNNPDDDGAPTAPFAATETSVSAVLARVTNSTGRPPSLQASFNARTGERLASSLLPHSFDVFQTQEVLGHRFFMTGVETFFADRLVPTGVERVPPPSFSRSMVMNGRYGALVTGMNLHEFFPRTQQYTQRFDPTKGAVPGDGFCIADPLPEGCISHNGTIVSDAEFDADGTLYLLDWMNGRVLALAPQATEFVEVARGFVAPVDLAIRYAGGQPAVLVSDGDVFAFRPEPGKVKVRGADQPPAALARPVLARRDLRDCLEDGQGPCLEDPPGATLELSNAPACLTGRGLGSAQGRVFAGTVEARVTEWSDTRACFLLEGEAPDGLLRLITAEGTMANRIAFSTPAVLTGWEIPERVTPRTVLRVRGRNLANATVTGGTLVERGEGFVDVRVPTPGPAFVTVSKGGRNLGMRAANVVPEVLHSCRVGRDDLCELQGIGFGPGSTVASALETLGYKATVSGQAARLTHWDTLRVRLRLPAGLATGVHPLVLEHPQGYRVETTVEIRSAAPEVLIADQPAPAALRFGHSRPVRTDSGVLVPADAWSFGTVNGVRTPLQFDTVYVKPGTSRRDGFPPIHDGPVERSGFRGTLAVEKPLHLVATPGGFLAAGQKELRPDVMMLLRLHTGSTQRESLELPVANFTQVGGAGMVGQRLVLVLSSTSSQLSTLVEVVLGADALTQGRSVTVSYSAIGDVVTSPVPTIGAWVSPAGVYLGSCRRPDKGASLRFVPVTSNPDG